MNLHCVHICCWFFGVCLTISTAVLAKDADNKELSRKHFKAGMSLLDIENYKVAAEEFETSIKLYPTKNGYFNLAVCYSELKRVNDALATIERLKKEFGDSLDETWQNEISTFEEKLKSAIVPVEFRTNIDKVTIKLDGKAIHTGTQRGAAHYLDPGEHTVTLSAEGYETITESIRINPGQGRTVLQFVMVRLSEEAVDNDGKDEAIEQNTTHPVHFKNDGAGGKKKKKRRIGTAIAFSIGGVAGLAAITTGVIHLIGVSQIRDICDGDYCEDMDMKGSVNKMLKLGVATNVLISVSAVGIVAGTILAFVEGRSSKDERRVSVGPSLWGDGGGLVLSGKF